MTYGFRKFLRQNRKILIYFFFSQRVSCHVLVHFFRPQCTTIPLELSIIILRRKGRFSQHHTAIPLIDLIDNILKKLDFFACVRVPFKNIIQLHLTKVHRTKRVWADWNLESRDVRLRKDVKKMKNRKNASYRSPFPRTSRLVSFGADLCRPSPIHKAPRNSWDSPTLARTKARRRFFVSFRFLETSRDLAFSGRPSYRARGRAYENIVPWRP